jgi:hypothetical protein
MDDYDDSVSPLEFRQFDVIGAAIALVMGVLVEIVVTYRRTVLQPPFRLIQNTSVTSSHYRSSVGSW